MKKTAKRMIVVGNWKMYVETQDEALALARAVQKGSKKINGVRIVVAPPYPFIEKVASILRNGTVEVSAQAVSVYAEAKHTGEVSAKMLKNTGCTLAIVGHSERREHESSTSVQAQVEQALVSGLEVVLCVGEDIRDTKGLYYTTLANQLKVLRGVPPKKMAKVTIAYEPVWAIGKGQGGAMRSEDVEEAIIFIRKTLAEMFPRAIALRTPVLYGGSVGKENIEDLVARGGVSGFLVGQASVTPSTFLDILQICAH